MRLPNLANNKTGSPVKFKFQLNYEFFFNISIFHTIFRTYTKNIIVYLKLKFNWMSFILSANPTGVGCQSPDCHGPNAGWKRISRPKAECEEDGIY